MKIENKTKEIADVQIPDGFTLTKDRIVIDFGKKVKGSIMNAHIKFTLEDNEEKFEKAYASCGCTTPKLTDISDNEQILNVGYNSKEVGKFTKQVTLYNKNETVKQIVVLKGEVSKN